MIHRYKYVEEEGGPFISLETSVPPAKMEAMLRLWNHYKPKDEKAEIFIPELQKTLSVIAVIFPDGRKYSQYLKEFSLPLTDHKTPAESPPDTHAPSS